MSKAQASLPCSSPHLIFQGFCLEQAVSSCFPPTHYKVQAVTDPLSTPSSPSPLCPDPTQWTEEQVYRWAEWTVQEFSLTSVNVPALRGISGHQLCSFGQQQFQELAYIKEHGLSLQQFLERIRGGELSATSQIEGRSNFIRSLSHRPVFYWLAVHKGEGLVHFIT